MYIIGIRFTDSKSPCKMRMHLPFYVYLRINVNPSENNTGPINNF